MSERGEFQPVETKNLFGVEKDIESKAAEIEEARFGRDFGKLRDLLQNSNLLENLIVRKNGGEYLKLVEWSVEAIYKELSGGVFGDEISNESVQKLVASGVSPEVLMQLANVYYHLKKSKQAKKLGTIMAETEDQPLVSANALNCLASLSLRQGDAKTASSYNHRAIEVLNETLDGFEGSPEEGLKLQRQLLKIEHGLVVDREAVRPWRDMEDQFLSIAERRKALNDDLLVPRTYLDIAELEIKLKDRDKARLYIDKAVPGLQKIGYENALKRAIELEKSLSKK